MIMLIFLGLVLYLLLLNINNQYQKYINYNSHHFLLTGHSPPRNRPSIVFKVRFVIGRVSNFFEHNTAKLRGFLALGLDN